MLQSKQVCEKIKKILRPLLFKVETIRKFELLTSKPNDVLVKTALYLNTENWKVYTDGGILFYLPENCYWFRTFQLFCITPNFSIRPITISQE